MGGIEVELTTSDQNTEKNVGIEMSAQSKKRRISSVETSGEQEDHNVHEIEEYYDKKPCNVGHSSEKIGTKEYFDQVEKRRYFVESHVPGFAEFEKYKGKRVLDVGCGIGTESINFARKGAHVTLIEVSSISLELAKHRFEIFGLENSADFHLGNAEELSTFLPPPQKPDEYYDLIWSFGVIHCTPHADDMLQEFKKYLNPKTGVLKLMVYSSVSYNVFYLMKEKSQWDFENIGNLVSRYCRDQTGLPILKTYTIESAKKLLERNGFVVQDIHKKHIFKYKVPEYKKFEYVVEDCWKDVPDSQFKYLEKELGWHTLITATLAQNQE